MPSIKKFKKNRAEKFGLFLGFNGKKASISIHFQNGRV